MGRKELLITNFKGVNSRASSSLTGSIDNIGTFEVLQGFDFFEDGSIRVSPGQTLVNVAGSTVSPIRFIGRLDNDASSTYCIIRESGRVSSISTSALTGVEITNTTISNGPILTPITKSIFARNLNFNKKLYVLWTNNETKPGVYLGPDPTAFVNRIGPAVPTNWATYRPFSGTTEGVVRMFVTNGDKVFYSATNDNENFTTSDSGVLDDLFNEAGNYTCVDTFRDNLLIHSSLGRIYAVNMPTNTPADWRVKRVSQSGSHRLRSNGVAINDNYYFFDGTSIRELVFDNNQNIILGDESDLSRDIKRIFLPPELDQLIPKCSWPKFSIDQREPVMHGDTKNNRLLFYYCDSINDLDIGVPGGINGLNRCAIYDFNTSSWSFRRYGDSSRFITYTYWDPVAKRMLLGYNTGEIAEDYIGDEYLETNVSDPGLRASLRTPFIHGQRQDTWKDVLQVEIAGSIYGAANTNLRLFTDENRFTNIANSNVAIGRLDRPVNEDNTGEAAGFSRPFVETYNISASQCKNFQIALDISPVPSTPRSFSYLKIKYIKIVYSEGGTEV